MAEKVTTMRLKVDLQCEKCYKKVKSVLCKFPQIRDQVYDHKNNIVTITVVCCNPEKLRDKLCCKGCGSIQSIEIVEPPKPKPPPEKPKPAPEKPKPAPEKPKPAPEKPKPAPPPCPPVPPVCVCPLEPPGCVCPPPPPVCVCPPAPTGCVCPPVPRPAAVPNGACCVPCSEGRPGGPCFHGYGGPLPGYDGWYGSPVYDSYSGGRHCYVRRCHEYLSDDNASGCTIM